MKKLFWNTIGIFCLGLAYLGVILPGFPYSIWVVAAAYCFSKGSERMHRWLYNHRLFGPFLTNWSEKRIFPTKMKFFMIGMMSLSLVLMYTGGVAIIGIVSTAVTMLIVAVWAWRFPGDVAAYDQRMAEGKTAGWFNNNI
jgi:uncharacterized membrane protein YbaN (DUF454 family)